MLLLPPPRQMIGSNFLCALLAGLLLVAPIAKAQQVLGPQASVQEIREIRAAGLQPELRLTYEWKQPGKPSQAVLLGIGQDYAYLKGLGRYELVDLLLRRIYYIDEIGQKFQAISLHRLVDHRGRLTEQAEAQLISLKKADDATARARLEAEYGVFPLSGSRSKLQRNDPTPDSVNFSIGNKDWIKLKLAPHGLNADQTRAYTRLVRLMFKMHPDATDYLERVRQPFAQVSFLTPTGDDQGVETQSLELTRMEEKMADYPLAANLTVTPEMTSSNDENDKLLLDLWPTMVDATRGHHGGGARQLEMARMEAANALRANRLFEAYLRFYEMIIQFGEDRASCDAAAGSECVDLGRATSKFSRDPQIMKLRQALVLGDDRAFDRASKLWLELDRKGPMGYFVDFLEANQLIQYHIDPDGGGDRSGLPTIREGFRRAIKSNPYVSPFYFDLGDYFYRLLRTDLAWICYDLGRSLPFTPYKAQGSQVDVLEQSLISHYAQFY